MNMGITSCQQRNWLRPFRAKARPFQKRRSAGLVLQVEQLEDRVTPSLGAKPRLDDLGLDAALRVSLDTGLGERPPAMPPAGGGSYHGAPPSGGGGGSGGGGHGQGDSGFMGGGGGGNQFGNPAVQSNGGGGAQTSNPGVSVAATNGPIHMAVSPAQQVHAQSPAPAPVKALPAAPPPALTPPPAPGGIAQTSTVTLASTPADAKPQAASTQLSYLDPCFNAVAGQTFSGTIDTFFDAAGGNAGSYAATIDWGDGSSSAGTVSGQDGAAGVQLSGSHVYQDAGVYNVVGQIANESDGQSLETTATANVADATLTGSPVTYSGQVGLYNDVVGSLTYGNPQATTKDFIATIAWGDGSSSSGLVVGQDGHFAVTGMHTYTSAAAYSVGVTVQDLARTTTSWDSTLYIGTQPEGNNVILAQDPTVNATEGLALNNVSLGTFSDSDNNTNPSLYTIPSNGISWGDGTSSSGAVSGSNPFTVTASHTYSEEGSYAVQVTVDDQDSNQFTITDTAIVADGALTVTGTNSPTNVVSGNSFTANDMVTFTDADPNGTTGDYSASVAWGDGQVSAGTIGTLCLYRQRGPHLRAGWDVHRHRDLQ